MVKLLFDASAIPGLLTHATETRPNVVTHELDVVNDCDPSSFVEPVNVKA